MVAVLQSSSGRADGAAQLTVTLPAAPTPGNLLVWAQGQRDTPAGAPAVQNLGPAGTLIGARARARADFGGVAWLYYRVAQVGDGQTWRYNTAGNRVQIVAELTGLLPTPVPGSALNANDNTGTILALAPPLGSFLIAAFVTRLAESGPVFTPNAESLTIEGLRFPGVPPTNHDGIALLYGLAGATIGATQGGTTQDGSYSWGAVGAAWDVPAPPPAPPRNPMLLDWTGTL